MKELLLNLLSGAIENIGESKLREVLQKLHDKNPELYKSAVKGGHHLMEALKPLVAETSNKIDDAVVNAIGDAIKDSAAANGVALD